MSFSSEVKEELSRHTGTARHCQIPEFAAIAGLCGRISSAGDGSVTLVISTENEIVARKCFTLLRKTFNINACNPVNIDEIKRGNVYEIKIDDSEQVIRILQTLKVYEDGRVANAKWLVNPMLIQMTCCKRAFIRGAFLASGSISDPNKFYHLEIVCDTPSQACQIRDVMNTFGAEAKVIQRKKYYVVYVKEGTQISDLLNVMEAGVALMNFENVRIVKEMRNSVNRQVNCETANLNKTVSAAVRQIEDIERIRDTVGLEYLAPGLRAVAIARLENPDMNLKDLGEILDPPVGKSGVNHRLRKIGEIAAELSGGDI